MLTILKYNVPYQQPLLELRSDTVCFGKDSIPSLQDVNASGLVNAISYFIACQKCQIRIAKIKLQLCRVFSSFDAKYRRFQVSFLGSSDLSSAHSKKKPRLKPHELI